MKEAVDQLADLQSQIHLFQIQELELIKDDGIGRYHGTLLDAIVYKQDRLHTDWNSLALFLKIKQKIVNQFTESQEVICLKLVGKKMKI